MDRRTLVCSHFLGFSVREKMLNLQKGIQLRTSDTLMEEPEEAKEGPPEVCKLV